MGAKIKERTNVEILAGQHNLSLEFDKENVDNVQFSPNFR